MADKRRGRLAGLLAGCATAAIMGLAVGLALGLGTWFFLRTERGNEFLRLRVEGALESLTPYGNVRIGRIRTDLWNDLALYDVVLLDEHGETLAFVERALFDLRLGGLLRRILSAPHVRLDGVYLDIELREDGVLNVARVFGQTEPGEPSDEEWTGLPATLDLPDLIVNGAHVLYRTPDGEALRAVGVDLRAAISGRETVEVRDLELSGLLVEPGPTALMLTGSAAWNADGLALDDVVVTLPRSEALVDGTLGETYDARIVLRRGHFPTLDPLIGEPGLIGTYGGELRISGDAESPVLKGHLTGLDDTVGTVRLRDFTIRGDTDPVRLEGALVLERFHLHHLVPQVDEPVIVNGTGELVILADDYPERFVLDARYDGGHQVAYGQEVESLRGRFRIQEGVLHLSDVHARGIVGDVDLTGTIDLEGGGMRLDIQATLEPGYLARQGVEGLRTTGRTDVTVTGNVFQTDTRPIRAVGTARWTPFGYDDLFRSEGLSARYDAAIRVGDAVTGTANAVITGGDARGVLIGEAQSSAVTFRVPLGGGTITASGPVVATDVVLPDTFSIEDGRGTWAVTLPPDGDMLVEAQLALGAHELLGFPGTSGTVGARVEGSDVQFDVELLQDARSMLLTAGRYNIDTAEVALDPLVLSLTPRATWTASRPVLFRLTDGGIADADIALTSELGRFDLQGTVGTRGPLQASIIVSELQLDTFAELFPDQVGGLSGALDLTATLSGTGSSPQITASVDLSGLWVEDTVRWLDIEGTLTADRRTLRPTLEIAVAGRPLGVLTGQIPVSLDLANPQLAPTRDVDLLLAIRPGAIERFELLSPAIEPGTLPTGRLSAAIEAQGPLRDPSLRIAGVAEVAVRNWADPARVEFDLRREDEDLVFWADLREGLKQRGNLSGSGVTRLGEVIAWAVGDGPEPDLEDQELWIDEMLVNGVLLGMPAEHVVAATGLDLVLAGEIVGGFTIYGSPYTPQIEGGLHWLEGTLGRIDLEGAYASVTPLEEGYALDIQLDFQDEGALSVVGTVPVRVDLREPLESWTAGEMDVTIEGSGLPLEVLAAVDPGVRNARGLLVIEGHVGGPVNDPSPDLTVTLENGRLDYAPLGLRLTEIDLDLVADARRLRLENFRMQTQPIRRNLLASGFDDAGARGGTVVAAGTAQLEDWAPTAMSVRVQLTDGVWVSATPELQMRLNGQVQASGAWPALEVDGDLSLVYGRVNIDTASFLTAAPLELSDTIVVYRPGVEPLVRAEEEPPLYRDFEVHVNLDVSRNLFLEMAIPWVEDLGTFGAQVTQALINARLGGGLEVTLQEGEPTLVGEVEVLEGRVQVLRSRFDTLEGTIIFAGGDPSNPNLDLHAQMNLPEATVDMFIKGTAEQPAISFASDEYPDETQILAILITGRAPEEIGGNQAQATAQALAGVFLNSLFAGQSLGNFTIDPEGAVEVGVPVSANVFATTRITPSPPLDRNRIAIGIEWSIAPRLVLSGGLGDRRSWADVFWEIRF